MQRDMDGKKNAARGHNLHMDSREKLVVNGVDDVESFNDAAIHAITAAGGLTITGRELRISKLNLDDGQLIVEGTIASLLYQDGPGARGSLFTRLFK